jgi:hypothetical protein
MTPLNARVSLLTKHTAFDPNTAVDARDDAKLDPISMHPACSSSDDQTDDADDLGRAAFFCALAWFGDADQMLRKIARLHRHEGQLHVLVREAVSQEMVHFIGRAVQVITGSRLRASNVYFHRPGAEWKRIWREKKWEAPADPLADVS